MWFLFDRCSKKTPAVFDEWMPTKRCFDLAGAIRNLGPSQDLGSDFVSFPGVPGNVGKASLECRGQVGIFTCVRDLVPCHSLGNLLARRTWPTWPFPGFHSLRG